MAGLNRPPCEHGYTIWPADALPADVGVAAAQARLRAAQRTAGEPAARLFEEAVVAASADLGAAAPADRAAAKLAIKAGLNGLRELAESRPEPEIVAGDGAEVFAAALEHATHVRDIGNVSLAREVLGGALRLGVHLDARGDSSFSFAEQAVSAIRVHDSIWAPAHEMARGLPGRGPSASRPDQGLAGR